MGEERSNIVDFSFDFQREIRLTAAAFAAQHGKNPYSDFILEHGRLPDRSEAVVIGRILGVQVRASDGSLQPSRTKSDMRARKKVRTEKARIWDQIAYLRAALNYLAKSDGDPALIVGEMISTDRLEIDANLEKSLLWLSRFAHEWIGHGGQVTKETAHVAARNLLSFEAGRIRADNDP